MKEGSYCGYIEYIHKRGFIHEHNLLFIRDLNANHQSLYMEINDNNKKSIGHLMNHRIPVIIEWKHDLITCLNYNLIYNSNILLQLNMLVEH